MKPDTDKAKTNKEIAIKVFNDLNNNRVIKWEGLSDGGKWTRAIEAIELALQLKGQEMEKEYNKLKVAFDDMYRKTDEYYETSKNHYRALETALKGITSLKAELEQARQEITDHKLANSILIDSDGEEDLANKVYQLQMELSQAKEELSKYKADEERTSRERIIDY